MGRLNELLGAAANYSRGIAAQFNLEEQEGVPTIAPEIVPVSEIHARPEQWALHGGTLLIGTGNRSAGGAGTHTMSAIEPGVGELVVIEGILFQPRAGAAQSLRLYWSNVALSASTGNLLARDARRIVTAGGSGASGTRIRVGTSAGSPPADLAGLIAQNINIPTTGLPYYLPLDLVTVSPWSVRLIEWTQSTDLADHLWFVRTRQATPRELAAGPGGAL